MKRERLIGGRSTMFALILLTLFIAVMVLIINFIVNKPPIKIGVVFDITGQSNLGVYARNAVELAVDEINSAGGVKGRRIEPILKDDKASPAEARAIDQKFVEDKIPVIIGHLITSTSLEGMKVVNGTDTIMISPTVTSTLFSNLDDNFLRVIEDVKYPSEMTASKAFADNSGGEMAIIYESKNESYSYDVSKYFKKKYTDLGGKIVLEDSYMSKPSLDFTELVKK